MPLRLQVISAHRESMGGSYVQEFAACGGTIGRSLECDWPLPDSKRYISSKHAMIDYQGRAYYLVDLSRNGVFVNDSDVPVGTGNPQRLFDGDKIRLGEFEISVAVIEDSSEHDEDGMQDSVVRAQLVQEDESMEMTMLSADKIEDRVAMDALLTPGDVSGELSGLNQLPPDAAISRQLKTEMAQHFLRSAGADPQNFKGLDPEELLAKAARLLAEFIEATHAMLKAKDEISSNLQIKASAQQKGTNPLRSAGGLDSALRLLLANSPDSSLTGTAAIETAFRELMQHQSATVRAMQVARSECDDRSASQQDGGRKRFDDEFARAYELESAD